jgi:hypothetical protein
MTTALDPNTGPGARVKKAAIGFADKVFGASFSGLAGAGGAEKFAAVFEGAFNTLGGVFEGLKSLFSAVGEGLGTFFRGMGGGDATRGVTAFFKLIEKSLRSVITLTEKLVGTAQPLFDLMTPGSATQQAFQGRKEMLSSFGSSLWEVVNPFGAQAEKATQAGQLARIQAQTRAAIDQTLAARRLAPGVGADWSALGLAAGQGFAVGLLGASPDLAGQDFAERAGAAVAGALGIHSPSRVFAGLGLFSAEGFALGLSKGAPMAREAALGLIPGGGDGAAIAALGGAAGASLRAASVSVTINNTITTQGDAAEVEERFSALTVESLAVAFERIGLSLGVQPG